MDVQGMDSKQSNIRQMTFYLSNTMLWVTSLLRHLIWSWVVTQWFTFTMRMLSKLFRTLKTVAASKFASRRKMKTFPFSIPRYFLMTTLDNQENEELPGSRYRLKSSCSHPVVILKSSWSHREVILKSSWSHPEVILRSSWGQKMKIESFRQVQAGRTDELTLAFLELLSVPKRENSLILSFKFSTCMFNLRESWVSSECSSLGRFMQHC